MTTERTPVRESFDRDTIRSVSKLLLTAGALVFVLFLVTLLPGIDRVVPLTPVTFAALVGVIATVAMVTVLLYLAPKLSALVRMTLDGPRPVVENLASVAFWLVVLAAVLVAHGGLAGAVAPMLDGLRWVYDVVFLLLALPAVVFVAVALYASLEPGADLLADRFADSGAAAPTERRDPENRTGESGVQDDASGASDANDSGSPDSSERA